MKFSRNLCFLLTVILIIFGSGVYGVAADEMQTDTSVLQGSHSLDATEYLHGTSRLVSNTEAALLFEVNSQTLLYGYNIDAPMYPSSFVKLMTLLIVLEEADLDEVVTVRQEVLNTVPGDAMSVYLSAGETMTIRDLLYCMMVGSGNDAAAVVADTVAGNQVAFVNRMNEFALELGCTGTKFMNVHGLHHDEQITTARDVAKILNRGLMLEEFRQIIGCSNYTVPANEVAGDRNLVTNNYLISTQTMEIYRDWRVTGGRTGVTNSRTRCIAATATSGNMELISIVMGCRSTYEADGYTERIYGGFPETTALLDLGFKGYKCIEIYQKDQVMRQHSVSGGESDVFLGTAESDFTVVPSAFTESDLSYVYKDSFAGAYPVAPIEQGTPLSSLQVWYGNICVAETRLYAMNRVTLDGPVVIPSIEMKNGLAWWAWLFIILGILLFLAFSFILALRYSKKFRRFVFARKRKSWVR